MHNTNQKQVKPAGKVPQQKNMLEIFIYFNFFYFPQWETSAMQQMQANQSGRMQISGDNRYYCTKRTQKKQKKAEKSNQSKSIK